MKARLMSAVSACVFTFTSIMTAQAASVSGQGTWETTLEGRDLDGNAATFEAYYDTVLDITWAANANIKGIGNWVNGLDTWDNQVAWAAGLTLGGVSGWRLPTVRPIDGSTFDTTFRNNTRPTAVLQPLPPMGRTAAGGTVATCLSRRWDICTT